MSDKKGGDIEMIDTTSAKKETNPHGGAGEEKKVEKYDPFFGKSVSIYLNCS
jgi:hypothetical protein